jgi:hypothetical protein
MGWTALAALLCLSACPETESFVTYNGRGEAGAAAHGGGDALSVEADAGAQPDANVSASLTTAPPGGKYAPKNIGAIWIETPSGELVKSLEVWAKTRRRWLTRYNAAVGTTGPVDVTTSATLPSHPSHHVTWNHRDRSGSELPYGAYRLCVEVTDASATGQSHCFAFDSSAGTQLLTPADEPYFKSMTLSVH